MGHTITEKMLAAKAHLSSCKPGDVIWCEPDLIMGHDLSAPHAFHEFQKLGIDRIQNRDKVVLVQDHFQPAKDEESARLAGVMREFASRHSIRHYFEVGRGGICHNLLIEKGMVRPGMLIAGADSHVCTFGALGALGWGIGATDMAALLALGTFWLVVPYTRKIIISGKLPEWVCGKDIILAVIGMLGEEGAVEQVLEFHGELFDYLPMVDRITIANMSVETGASSAIIKRNHIVDEYLARFPVEPFEHFETDPDASFFEENVLDVSSLEPLVAAPHSPSNVCTVRELEDVKVDQVFLGSCTNGTIEDFRRFRDVLGDHVFAEKVRVIAVPATQEVYLKAMEEGILRKIVEAGGVVSTPTCGPCLGGHCGVLGAGETCLSTSNRNFRGRMGHAESQVYLASPWVAAATAITGKITHPADIPGARV